MHGVLGDMVFDGQHFLGEGVDLNKGVFFASFGVNRSPSRLLFNKNFPNRLVLMFDQLAGDDFAVSKLGARHITGSILRQE